MGKIQRLLIALVIGTKYACAGMKVIARSVAADGLTKRVDARKSFLDSSPDAAIQVRTHSHIIDSDDNIRSSDGLVASTEIDVDHVIKSHADDVDVERARDIRLRRKGQLAYVLRGESFRTKRTPDVAQGGPQHRKTCGPGSEEIQQSLSQQHMGHVKYLESLGFNVTVMGTTYECSSGSVSSYKVAEALPKLYDGRLKLDLQDKAMSSQLTGLRRALQLVLESSVPYDYVVLNRWDNGYPFNRWACWLSKGLDWLEDMDTLNGPGKNSDVTFVIPGKHIENFNKFINKENSACCGHGAQCETVCNYCRVSYLREMFNVTDQNDKVLDECPEGNDGLKQKEKYVDPFDGVPLADLKCLKEKGFVN